MAPKRKHEHDVDVKVKPELTAQDIKEEFEEQAETLTGSRSRRVKREPKAEANPEPESEEPLAQQQRTPRKQRVKSEAKAAKSPSAFSTWRGPTPEECSSVHAALVQVHGAPARTKLAETGTALEKPASTQLVLDSLCRTILSQNTTDATSAVAFSRLKAAFPTWRSVLESDSEPVEDAIRCGGLAAIKVARIKTILQWILDNRPQHCSAGEPSLEYCRDLDTEAVKSELSQFKGCGPKTISCVLMFTLERADFPVDTHVWRITKERLKWVPKTASREATYDYLNSVIPDHLKFDLHVLLVKHGKVCMKCAKLRNKKHTVECPF